MEDFFKLLLKFWVVIVLGNLFFWGVIIWSIIRLVNHATGTPTH